MERFREVDMSEYEIRPRTKKMAAPPLPGPDEPTPPAIEKAFENSMRLAREVGKAGRESTEARRNLEAQTELDIYPAPKNRRIV